MTTLDEAQEAALKIVTEAKANLHNIRSEEDAKLQIILRMLVEVLGWQYADISAERQHNNGFSDFILSDRAHRAFLVEAKRIGRINLRTYSDRRQYYKLSGPALSDAQSGILQAASYCSPEGIQLGVLTDGLTWIVFLPHVPNAPFMEKQGIVFPTLDSILADFAEFYALLSKHEHKTNTYKIAFDRLHENRLVLTSKLVAPFSGEEIERVAKSALSFDLETVFSKFFSNMSGDTDPQLAIQCFVETKESRIADFALERITANVLGNLSPKTTSVDDGLASIVRDTVEGEAGQTIFIVGPSGAGKSTYLRRFFTRTLSGDTRERCVVININSLDATGDEQTAIEWMREKAISTIEIQIFENGHPSWNDLRSLYHTDYVRRAEGIDAILYQRSKDEFREKFSEFMDDKVNSDREGYLNRLLADLVHNRKKLPVFVIDNTDEFSILFKERIFQYFQALRRSTGHCLLIFPATDKSAWSFSKTEIFNIYTSKSFFLPTPSPREVFRKRVHYLKEKLDGSSTDRTKARYFSDQGIRINIPDLEKFASVLEEIFVDQDYAARRIGELANYNIRKTLGLAQRIITSSYLDISSIVASYVTGELATLTPAKFMGALLKGDYNFYRSDDGHEVLSIFQTDSEIKQSPLNNLRVLLLFSDTHRNASEDKQRYIEVRSVYNFFELMAVPEPAIERSLMYLLNAGLLEPYDASMKEYAQDQRLAITHSGLCHFALGKFSPVYFEQMALTTGIVDEEAALSIRSKYLENTSQNEKMEKIRALFSAYLATEDEKYCLVPNTPEFSRQAALRSEFVAHWAGVDRTEQAEEIALYGLVAERVVCRVDWFDRFKGFGFVKVENYQGGAFLHSRILEAVGILEVYDGDGILCDISQNEQGLVVSAAYEIVQQKSQVYVGRIVHLNERDAYGFVNIKEIGADAFLRYSIFPREERGNIAVGNELRVELAVDKIGRYQVKKVYSPN